MLHADPDVSDLQIRVLVRDVEGFENDLRILQQKKPLSRWQIDLVLSYIDKVSNRKMKADFLTILGALTDKVSTYYMQSQA